MPAKLPPIPVPDPISQPFWDAAREGVLAIQRCRQCREWFHPPDIICASCGSEELAFEPVSGKGTVYAYSIMYDRRVYGFEDRIPYVNVIVELPEQPLLTMVTNLIGAGVDEVKVGLPVEVTFEKLTDEITLPQFRPA